MIYLFLLIGSFLLIKGADLFVDGFSSIAGILRIPWTAVSTNCSIEAGPYYSIVFGSERVAGHLINAGYSFVYPIRSQKEVQ